MAAPRNCDSSTCCADLRRAGEVEPVLRAHCANASKPIIAGRGERAAADDLSAGRVGDTGSGDDGAGATDCRVCAVPRGQPVAARHQPRAAEPALGGMGTQCRPQCEPAPGLRVQPVLRHPAHDRPGRPAQAADQVHRLRQRERPRAVPVPHSARIEAGGDRHVLSPRATATSTSCTARIAPSAAGRPPPARSSTCARTGCGPPAGRRPMRPVCRSRAGLVRPAEIRAGHIDHALRFTVERTQRGYIHPATHQAGSTTPSGRPADGRAVPAQGVFLAARLSRRRRGSSSSA